MTIEEWVDLYKDMVSTLAAEYYRRYPMVEQEDIQQDLWLWFVSHPNKYKEWSKLEVKDRDKLIGKSLRNAGIKYCEREKSRKSGYDQSDLYYYDVTVVEAFLPSIIADTYEMPKKIKDLNFKFGKGEVTDGNNWLVLRADISKAFHQLSEAKQNILRIRYTLEDSEWTELGKELNTSPDGARMKVHRAMGNLVKILGGYRPYEEPDSLEELIENAYDE